jgi:zinc transport system ATP-binding protein
MFSAKKFFVGGACCMAVNDTEALIACQNAAFGYDGYAVISALNFTVKPGDYLCVVGRNGSGKSTLVKGMLRLLDPLQGSITFCGEFKSDSIGYLPQQVAAQKDFPAGAFEIILSGAVGGMGLRPFYSAKEKQRTREIMDRLGIGDLKERCFRELSGGQQRRVLIGRALCASRRALVLDEPAAGLDPLAAAELYSLLQKINRETGVTIIMVSHDIDAAERYATNILHLQNKQCFFGTYPEYMNSDIGKQFLGAGKEKESVF